MSELSRASGRPLAEIQQSFRTAGIQATSAASFDALIPQTGWLHDYMEWTLNTEAPSVFHFFVAAATVGSTLGRRVFFDKGAYILFPNLSIMLIAPAGRCRKTSAANLGISLLTQTGGRLLADKVTPEALVDSLKQEAQALIYAAELAVFLGRQKYQEGMVPLLTALLDCPKEWIVKTMGRGETVLKDVCISALCCSTIDWLQTAVPADTFGGGFMSRFLFVVQEETGRCFPLPPPLSKDLKVSLVRELAKLRTLRTTAVLAADAERWYRTWYIDHQRSRPPEGHFSGYWERKPDHVLRLSMILRASDGALTDGSFTLSRETVERAERILTWLESWLPMTFDRVAGSAGGEDQIRLIRQLRQNGGSLGHSALLRRNSSKLNAEQFRRAIQTLTEATLLEWNQQERTYTLTPQGWGCE